MQKIVFPCSGVHTGCEKRLLLCLVFGKPQTSLLAQYFISCDKSCMDNLYNSSKTMRTKTQVNIALLRSSKVKFVVSSSPSEATTIVTAKYDCEHSQGGRA